MSERHTDKKPADPGVNVPGDFEHISAPTSRVLAKLAEKMEKNK